MKQSPIICIVDDDDAVRGSLENYLRATGLQVCSFASAESFLSSLWRTKADCLVTDLHMPGMDGLALQRELNRRGCDFPLIMMTAYPTEPAREESLRLGAADFLSKPVDPDALLDRIETILRGGPNKEKGA